MGAPLANVSRRWSQAYPAIPDTKTSKGPLVVSGSSVTASFNAAYSQIINRSRNRVQLMKDLAGVISDFPELWRAACIIRDMVVQGDQMDVSVDDSAFSVSVEGPTNAGQEIEDAIDRTRLQQVVSDIVLKKVVFGDNFEEIVYGPDSRAIRLDNLAPTLCLINRDPKTGIANPEKPFARLDPTGSRVVQEYEAIQIAQFSNSKDRATGYGISHFVAVLRVAEQLRLMEDGTVVTSITDIGDRLAVEVDCSNVPHDEQWAYVETWKQMIGSAVTFNATTQRLSFEVNPIRSGESLFIPRRIGDATSVRSLPGGNGVSQMPLVLQYFREKMVAVTGVPPALMGLTSGMAGKGFVSEQSAQTARIARSIQKETGFDIRDLCLKFAAGAGINPLDIKVKVRFAYQGTTEAIIYWNILKAAADVASYLEHWIPPDLVFTRLIQPLLRYKQDEVAKILKYIESGVAPSILPSQSADSGDDAPSTQKDKLKAKPFPGGAGASPQVPGRPAKTTGAMTGTRGKKEAASGFNLFNWDKLREDLAHVPGWTERIAELREQIASLTGTADD